MSQAVLWGQRQVDDPAIDILARRFSMADRHVLLDGNLSSIRRPRRWFLRLTNPPVTPPVPRFVTPGNESTGFFRKLVPVCVFGKLSKAIGGG